MFIDDLAFLLFVLGFVGALTLYMTISVYYNYVRKKRLDIYDIISGGILPLGALGLYLVIMGLYGQFTWPLPGSFNTLFFDPIVALGIILVGFAWSIRTRQKMHYVGLLSLLVGFMVIYYGFAGYALGLSQEPIALFGLFLTFGIVGVLAFPVSLIVDLEPGRTSAYPKLWFAVLVLFWLALLCATIIAFSIAGAALYSHLISAP